MVTFAIHCIAYISVAFLFDALCLRLISCVFCFMRRLLSFGYDFISKNII